MGKYFELKAVSRGEWEALKRFSDYEELSDGTLMRMEGSKEFRVYREDVEGFPFHVMTSGLISEIQETYRRRMVAIRESRATGERAGP